MGTGQRKMPQSRRGSGAADGSRMGVMPRSSNVQPARVGSAASVSMAVWVLLVSIVGFPFSWLFNLRHTRTGARRFRRG